MTALLMVWLLCAEFSTYSIVRTENHLFVDESNNSAEVEIPVRVRVRVRVGGEGLED